MKKILVLLSSFVLLTISSTSMIANQSVLASNNEELVSNYQINNNESGEWTWNSVGISHSVTTNAAGLQIKIDSIKSFKAVSSDTWVNYISRAKNIVASGYFALHTYNGPKFSESEVLKLDENQSSNTLKQWDWYGESDTWNGWGHHTSKITLSLIAKYDQVEETASLTMYSTVYARTAGAVHSCSTTSQIRELKLVI